MGVIGVFGGGYFSNQSKGGQKRKRKKNMLENQKRHGLEIVMDLSTSSAF